MNIVGGREKEIAERGERFRLKEGRRGGGDRKGNWKGGR
jgi:hypothetical protein